MKSLVLALSLISSPLFCAYSRYDFYDTIELFLESCRIENDQQYDRLNGVLRAIESLDEREKDIIHAYVSMVAENAQLSACCCSDEDLDEMIQEVWDGCDSCGTC